MGTPFPRILIRSWQELHLLHPTSNVLSLCHLTISVKPTSPVLLSARHLREGWSDRSIFVCSRVTLSHAPTFLCHFCNDGLTYLGLRILSTYGVVPVVPAEEARIRQPVLSCPTLCKYCTVAVVLMRVASSLVARPAPTCAVRMAYSGPPVVTMVPDSVYVRLTFSGLLSVE